MTKCISLVSLRSGSKLQRAFFLVAVASMIVGCGEQELTREMALERLRQLPAQPLTEKRMVTREKIFYTQQGNKQVANKFCRETADFAHSRRSIGPENLEQIKFAGSYGVDFSVFLAELRQLVIADYFAFECDGGSLISKITATGKRNCDTSSTIANPCNLVLGKISVKDVTGITTEGESRIVEYTMEFVPAGGNGPKTLMKDKYHAVFRKYDDGWRLQP